MALEHRLWYFPRLTELEIKMNPFTQKSFICGDFRYPRQMLGEQVYEGHLSVHDDGMAKDLGLNGAPIEGPTHFSQFVPLLYEVFGDAWFERGCISAHYQNMVVEGEEVRAFVSPGEQICDVWAEKRDGTQVLKGTASIGPKYPDSEIDNRLANLRPVENLVIHADVEVGQKIVEEEPVIMQFDQIMGDMYPFSLNHKLQCITEDCAWYSDADASPWGRAVIPVEMISVLTHYTSRRNEIPVKGPAVGLFADQEIKLIKGPLFVNQPYRLEREVIALSESRRVESHWLRTSIFDGSDLVAECILNSAVLKNSYAPYESEARALGKNIE